LDVTNDDQPIILLNAGETFTGLGGRELTVLTREEAKPVADDDCPGFVTEVEPHRRTFDLEAWCRCAAPCIDAGGSSERPARRSATTTVCPRQAARIPPQAQPPEGKPCRR
jgi:hypothetical protein